MGNYGGKRRGLNINHQFPQDCLLSEKQKLYANPLFIIEFRIFCLPSNFKQSPDLLYISFHFCSQRAKCSISPRSRGSQEMPKCSLPLLSSLTWGISTKGRTWRLMERWTNTNSKKIWQSCKRNLSKSKAELSMRCGIFIIIAYY